MTRHRPFTDAGSLLPFAVGTLVVLVAFALRAPSLYSTPTVTADDLRLLCVERGAALPVFFEHYGAVHLLPMALAWVTASLLPLSAVPYAYSLSSLLLASLTIAVVLHPLSSWLPLLPGRVAAFALLVVLPLQGRFMVACAMHQHLGYFLLAAIVLISSLAPTAEERLSTLSRPGFCLLCVFLGLCVFSAPMSPCLVAPIVIRMLFRMAWTRRQIVLASIVVAAAAVYGFFCLDIAHSAVSQAGARGALTLLWEGSTLFVDRVGFESLFGLSAKLTLHKWGVFWIVYAAGASIVGTVGLMLVRCVRRRDREAFFAVATATTALTVVLFSVLGRSWLEPEGLAVHFTNARYFAPSAMLWLLCIVTLLAPHLHSLRSPAVLFPLVVWAIALNFFDDARYAEPIAALLAEHPDVTTLRDLPRRTREAESREFLFNLGHVSSPLSGVTTANWDAICSANWARQEPRREMTGTPIR